MKQKFIKAFMDVAARFASLSSAKRLQVGAIVVKDDRIISIGYNGMPSGWTNECEDKIYCDDGDCSEQQLPKTENLPWLRYKLVTKREVLHAETNAIAKLAKSTESGDGAVLFVTHSPCLDCAKLIFQSGIRNVFYRDSYRNTDGITFLEKSGITVTKV
jgi:dCMP deaminase